MSNDALQNMTLFFLANDKTLDKLDFELIIDLSEVSSADLSEAVGLEYFRAEATAKIRAAKIMAEAFLAEFNIQGSN